ncbi:hypothetical protein B0T13DRAFT_400159, partial [Neurospora crassa]
YIHSNFGIYFNNLALIHLNTILVSSSVLKKDYSEKVCKVVKYLVVNKLQLDLKKYKHNIKSIKCLNYIIIVSTST